MAQPGKRIYVTRHELARRHPVRLGLRRIGARRQQRDKPLFKRVRMRFLASAVITVNP